MHSTVAGTLVSCTGIGFCNGAAHTESPVHSWKWRKWDQSSWGWDEEADSRMPSLHMFSKMSCLNRSYLFYIWDLHKVALASSNAQNEFSHFARWSCSPILLRGQVRLPGAAGFWCLPELLAGLSSREAAHQQAQASQPLLPSRQYMHPLRAVSDVHVCS